MFTRKKTDAKSVIEEVLDYCISNDIGDYYALKKKNKSRHTDLLFAVAEIEGIDYLMNISHITYDLCRLRFRSGDEREVVEDLMKNFEKSLDGIPQLTQKINELIEEAWQTYYDDYPETMPLSETQVLINDDNRDRARSLRGI